MRLPCPSPQPSPAPLRSGFEGQAGEGELIFLLNRFNLPPSPPRWGREGVGELTNYPNLSQKTAVPLLTKGQKCGINNRSLCAPSGCLESQIYVRIRQLLAGFEDNCSFQRFSPQNRARNCGAHGVNHGKNRRQYQEESV